MRNNKFQERRETRGRKLKSPEGQVERFASLNKDDEIICYFGYGVTTALVHEAGRRS